MRSFWGLLLLVAGLPAIAAEPIDDDFSGMVSRVEVLEAQVAAIQAKLGLAKGCPCLDGICDEDCDCDLCPKKTAECTAVAASYAGRPNSRGRHVRIASAPDCRFCGILIRDLVDVADNVAVKKYPSVAENPHEGLPYVFLLENGKIEARLHHSYKGKESRIREWLAGQTNATTGAAPATRAAPVAGQPQPQTTRRVTRYAGQRWDVEGVLHPTQAHLERHLRSHGLVAAGLSYSDMLAAHDNFHNVGHSGVGWAQPARVTRVAAPTRVVRFAPYSGYSSCPSCIK